MERVKEGGRGGEERKETLGDKPLDFEKPPTRKQRCHAVIHVNKPTKSSAFRSGSEP